MKLLLFDQNLSPRLVNRLADLYPGSVHLDSLGLGEAGDREIWEYARSSNRVITNIFYCLQHGCDPGMISTFYQKMLRSR